MDTVCPSRVVALKLWKEVAEDISLGVASVELEDETTLLALKQLDTQAGMLSKMAKRNRGRIGLICFMVQWM